MEEIETKKVKVKIEGDKELKSSLKNLRDRNGNKPEDESYEDIFNAILSDKRLMPQLGKYVENKLNYPNTKLNIIAVLHRNLAIHHSNNGNFEDALKHVNTCLCFAYFLPDEMAVTYLFRSAVYNELELFEFSLNDINLAELFANQGYNFSTCYYNMKESLKVLQNASYGFDFNNPLSEHENIKLWFQNLKSMAEALMKKQEENKVEAEQETVDKMMNLNIKSRPNATESESLKTDEGVLLDEKNPNINTGGNENVGNDFSGITENARPHVQGMAKENLKQNSYRNFLEILDVEDSNNSFNYSAITLNDASLSLFCQDESNLERGFSDDVEVCYNQETGFRLKAKNTLRPGTIITTDKPYVANVNPDMRRYYCCYCFQRADIMMIPCNYCSEVRFCSVQCQMKGWSKFHYVECGYSGFLSRTDQTGYLCMRILLKIGVQKVASLKPHEPVGFKDHKLNLKDPEEYYRFLYNMPFKNSSASNKTEAALGAVILLFFLEEMYNKIAEVENGYLAEAIKPSNSFGMKTFTQPEKKLLGLRIVKHWLQLDIESIMYCNKRLYITYLEEEIDGLYYEDAADYVLPLLHLFNHSCDPNVYSVRFEGGPEIFRAARTIRPGEFLTVSKGADIYRHDYRERYEILKTYCPCGACKLEVNKFPSKKPDIRTALIKKLTQVEEFLTKKQYETCLELILDISKQERLENWMFWKLQRYIIEALHSSHFYPEKQSLRSAPEFVIAVVKAAVQPVKYYLSESLFTFVTFSGHLLEYVAMIRKLSVSAPSVLDTPNGQNTLSELLKLMQDFKEKFLRISMKTHHELCIYSMLRSEERSLNALINRNMSS